MTTFGQIIERIKRLYYGGNIPDDAELHDNDIGRLVVDACNVVMKLEQVNVSERMKNYFPPHALIATYTGLAPTNTDEPELSLVCTPLVEGGITTGGPTMSVTPQSEGDNEWYDISITGISWGETTPAAVEAFISAASDSCAVNFGGLTSTPDSFLAVGITDLVVTSTTLTFSYFPDATPNAWQTAGGDGWIDGDSFLWVAPADEDGTTFTVPTLIADYVADTHAILEGLSMVTNYPNSLINQISVCCVDTDVSEIDSEITLPAIPIQLERNLGIWRIWSDTLGYYEEFIPVRSGELSLSKKTTHTNAGSVLDGQIVYEWKDRYTIRINSPISVIGSSINVQLLIVDPNTLAKTDILPLHPDMQDTVVKEVLKMLGVVIEVDKVNDDQDSRS